MEITDMLRQIFFAIIALGLTATVQAVNVFLLGDTEAETQVKQALEDAGHTVTFGGLYNEWDGITPDIQGFDVTVLLNGEGYGYLLQTDADTAIDQFVSNGGGLIMTEWTAYDVYYDYKSATIANLMPVASPDGDYSYGFTWRVIDKSHPLANGIPASWYDAAASSYVNPKAGTCVVMQGIFEGRVGNPLLSYSGINGGTVIYINHDMTYTTDTMSVNALQIVLNSVEFAALPFPPSVICENIFSSGFENR